MLANNVWHRFRLVNMRKPVKFAFLQSGLFAPLLTTFSSVITPHNPNEPLQIHMALTGKAGYSSYLPICHSDSMLLSRVFAISEALETFGMLQRIIYTAKEGGA